MFEFIGVVAFIYFGWKILRYFFKSGANYNKEIAVIKNVISSQIERLQTEGENFFIDEVVYLYVWAISLSCLSTEPTLSNVKIILKEILGPNWDYHKDHVEMLNQALLSSPVIGQQMDILVPIAQNELKNNNFSYLYSYSKKANKEVQLSFTQDSANFDPSKRSIKDMLSV